MVLKTHLEPFREPLKVPPVGQQKNPFSKSEGTLGFALVMYCAHIIFCAPPPPMQILDPPLITNFSQALKCICHQKYLLICERDTI